MAKTAARDNCTLESDAQGDRNHHPGNRFFMNKQVSTLQTTNKSSCHNSNSNSNNNVVIIIMVAVTFININSNSHRLSDDSSQQQQQSYSNSRH
jgi:hypothetical protein